jgi:predicted nucleic acid-binding Zn ribbon protein
MPRSYDQCVRCGKATPWGKSVCRECNPAGLPEPSPSQYHATVFVTVLATLVVLVVIAMLLR